MLALSDFIWSPIVDYVHPRNDAVLPDAIMWCLGEKELERGPHLAEDTMRSILGAELVDIWDMRGEPAKEDEPW